MKLIVLDGYALNPGDLSYECLNQFGDVTIYDRTDSEEEAISRIGDSEIVLVNKVPITESLLAACPNIRLICVQATGYNVIDCAACAKRGIPVTNVPSYGTAAVAQFTMAMILELCHRADWPGPLAWRSWPTTGAKVRRAEASAPMWIWIRCSKNPILSPSTVPCFRKRKGSSTPPPLPK